MVSRLVIVPLYSVIPKALINVAVSEKYPYYSVVAIQLIFVLEFTLLFISLIAFTKDVFVEVSNPVIVSF